LPAVDGLYVGGGYPELHGAALSVNKTMLAAVQAFAVPGRPIYAECGGLMYLADALEDLDGATHAMVGVLPATVRMLPRRLSLTEVMLQGDSPLGAAGTSARGHVFHDSSLEPVPDSVPRVYRLARRSGGEGIEGYLIRAHVAEPRPSSLRLESRRCERVRRSVRGREVTRKSRWAGRAGLFGGGAGWPGTLRGAPRGS
jgi:cobyrinic acid a,c-diamide synthase